jgi:hypothetical protein
MNFASKCGIDVSGSGEIWRHCGMYLPWQNRHRLAAFCCRSRFARLESRTVFARVPQPLSRPAGEKQGSVRAVARRASSRGGGNRLGEAERALHQRSFGQDLSGVRVHNDARAAELTAGLAAQAVTVGDDIYFGPRAYAPGTGVGRRLLAHEIAHVIQHRGGDARPGGPVDPERAAARAADESSRHGIVGFGLRPTPIAPARQSQTWDDAVAAARKEPDPAKRSAARLGLIQRALPDRTVRLAGTSSPTAVDPADYAAAPTVNFDERLNSKTRYNSKKSVGDDVGYTFYTTTGKTKKSYSILGPKALDTGHGEAGVRQYADHELFHAAHPIADGTSKADDELAAWTDTFTHHFLATYMMRESWSPLVDYYEDATGTPRSASLNAIVAFVNTLSTTAPTKPRPEREQFQQWLDRQGRDPAKQSKQLIVDLGKKFPAKLRPSGSSTPSSSGSAAPPPSGSASPPVRSGAPTPP